MTWVRFSKFSMCIAAASAAISGCSGCHGLASLDVAGSDDVASARKRGPVVPGPSQLRLLNADEYRNTVRDLLGVEASNELPLGQLAGGFDTGTQGRVDENTLFVLLTEAERLAADYVAHRLPEAWPCAAGGEPTFECIDLIIHTLAPRAFRRPLADAELAALTAFSAEVAAQTGSRALAVEFLVARLLTSPHFLYRREIGTPTDAVGAARALDPFERASFISYGVTGSMPDAPLLHDAAEARLDEPGMRAHVRRLMDTPAGRTRLVSFFKQWLRVGALDAMAADPSRFPKLQSADQGAALRDEFSAFVTSVVFEDGDGRLSDLLGATHTIVDRHTAPLYGLPEEGAAPRRVHLDPRQRRGVLTLASVMAAHGAAGDVTADRPVKRGLLVLNQFLCGEVGPPSGINTATASSEASAQVADFDALTVREQFDVMMQQGAECRGCHQQFMPLGYAFGRYDALGRYVTDRGGRTIDPAVTDAPVGGGQAAFADALGLVDAVAGQAATSACFARKLATWTAGIGAGAHLDALAAELAEDFAANDQDIRALVEDALVSPHLHTRRP